MTELNEAALDAASGRGEFLLPRELLVFVERFDDAAGRGVSLSRLEAYADVLEERSIAPFTTDEIGQLVAEDRTDADRWAGPDAIYEVGDGYSAFPPAWHDALEGEDDLKTFVDVIIEDLEESGEHEGTGAAGRGVPEQLLLDAADALGPFSRSSARAELQELRDEGVLAEDADQHPDARVYPADETPRD